MTTTNAAAAGPVGVVYLLHFDRRYGHAGHYTGWTTDLPARLTEHAAGRGARLLAVITAAGIGWQLARTWPGSRARERALKRQGGAGRRCPLCRTGIGRAGRLRPTEGGSEMTSGLPSAAQTVAAGGWPGAASTTRDGDRTLPATPPRSPSCPPSPRFRGARRGRKGGANLSALSGHPRHRREVTAGAEAG